MSELQGSTNDFINQLVVKAIEKKKKNEQTLANKLKPRLEHVLFSQFDVLETIESHNQKTTLYRLAKKDEPEKQICCKVLNSEQPEHVQEMFVAEATHLEVAQHPSIIDFIKLGNEFERPYFMYKWAEGESVAEKLTRHKYKSFRHDHIAWLIYQLAGALEYIHTKGICHLDIKPSNIIICEDDSIKLIDFGAAQYINDSRKYNEASLSYASPKYIESGKAVPQDDVYSMALLVCALFTGYSDNNDWKALLQQRKRPHTIPKTVWNLLRLVVTKPRTHGLTPISFAQALAHIDMNVMQGSHNAPLFTQLRNADLVLRKSSKYDVFRLGRFKYLEASLAACLCLITFTVLLKSFAFTVADNNAVSLSDTSSRIKPAQAATFLSQPPWEIENALDNNSSDVVSLAPYREAVDVQNSQLRIWYGQEQEELKKERLSQVNQFTELDSIHKDMIILRDYLDRNVVLSSSVDRRLTKLMASVNNLKLEHQKYNYSSMLEDEALAKNVMLGDSKGVEEYMRKSWIKSQANSYYYAYVLPKQVLNQVISSVDEHAKTHFYSKAIDEINEAIKLYGDTVELSSKKAELIVKRSEYVLFGTVTGEMVFEGDKLTTALEDLHGVAPARFKEVSDLLKKIAKDSLDKSFQQDTPAEGALAIEKALNAYQKKVTI
ncbi:serine/threonine protein kinase [Aliivibrio fischeri]|uniref:serine/threonine protein kinase n=1 Tax=Aliivibrio fischeri TaxID=668 RepID=UPI0009080182|nr:protein kinase [Aliivibrio fischeri]